MPSAGPELDALLASLRARPLTDGLLLSSDGRLSAFYVPLAEQVPIGEALRGLEQAVTRVGEDADFDLLLAGPVVAETTLGRMVLRDLACCATRASREGARRPRSPIRRYPEWSREPAHGDSMLTSLLLLGFWTGMRHALEADHVAAIATIASRSRSSRELLRIATAWGIGHGAVLVFAAASLGVMGVAPSAPLAALFEVGAGAVLVLLGLEVLLRIRRRGVRVSAHRHPDGTRHIHPHRGGEESDHEHPSPRRMLRRALGVGGAHGLAGSAALGLLAAQGAVPGWGVVYALCFAAGSILGMLALSLTVVLPIERSRLSLEALRGRMEWVLGLVSVALGLWVGAGAAVSAMTLFTG